MNEIHIKRYACDVNLRRIVPSRYPLPLDAIFIPARYEIGRQCALKLLEPREIWPDLSKRCVYFKNINRGRGFLIYNTSAWCMIMTLPSYLFSGRNKTCVCNKSELQFQSVVHQTSTFHTLDTITIYHSVYAKLLYSFPFAILRKVDLVRRFADTGKLNWNAEDEFFTREKTKLSPRLPRYTDVPNSEISCLLLSGDRVRRVLELWNRWEASSRQQLVQINLGNPLLEYSL